MKITLKNISQAFFFVLLLVHTSLVNAEVTDAQVYQLLDKSGATRSIESLPMQMQGMGQQMALTAKDPAEHQKMMNLITSSIDTDVMLQKMLASIKANATSQDLNNIMGWLNSDLGNRFVQAELQAAEPEFQSNLMRFMADMQSKPPTQERTSAILNFIHSSKMIDQTMSIVMDLIENMFAATKALNPEDKELATNLDAQVGQMEAMIKPAIEQQMVITSHYIYKDMSLEELNKYSDFYQQPVGKKYLSLVFDASSKALNDWGTNLVKQIDKQEKAK